MFFGIEFCQTLSKCHIEHRTYDVLIGKLLKNEPIPPEIGDEERYFSSLLFIFLDVSLKIQQMILQ